MAAPTAAAASAAAPQAPPPASKPNGQADQHAREVEEREGYEYWGYLFKPDKTGTDKLKGLLRGLKDVMNTQYEPSDNADLTPTRLAHFYRDLHGNYDQLFLGTPSESIAFIYKSLGCLHSLQPLPQSTAFTDPTVPALKTEGWIMWQTIQLLLGPEEHSSFLIEALQRWDVKDPTTGQTFPKVLPRRCFPQEPDKHMVAWYEGVSERLRKEAEEEERQREIEAEQAEVRRLHDRVRKDDDDDDEGSLDSRGPALAYFRNPLYRHVDGRPSIVRRESKRPQISPRPTTIIDKGKGAATSVGHVIRNIGSPHLWDGRKTSNSRSRERDHRGQRRRGSQPETRYRPPGEPPAPGPNDAIPSPDYYPPSGHHRHRSSHGSGHDDYDADDSAAYSPRPTSRHDRHHHSDHDPSIRHSRSHEPTPSQKEGGDYFEGYDNPSRRNSSTPSATNNLGPSFGPSASPLFASHVAKQPPPRRPSAADAYGAPRPSPSMRRTQGERPYSRSPAPRSRSHARDDRGPPARYDSPRRSRHGSPGGRSSYEDAGPPPPPPGPPSSHGPPPMGAYHHTQPGFPPVNAPITAPPGPYPVGGGNGGGGGGGGGHGSRGDRRSAARASGSDGGGLSPDDRDRDRERDRRGAPPKQTRFAAGVDGRRYPNETPWR